MGLRKKIKNFYLRRMVITDYYGDLSYQISRHKERFPNAPRKTASRLIWWNFKSLFKHHLTVHEKGMMEDREKEERLAAIDSSLDLLERQSVNIGMYAWGGIGDYIIHANYLFKLRQKYSSPLIRIFVFVWGSYQAAEILFGPEIVDGLYLVENNDIYQRGYPDRFDLFIELIRFPRILSSMNRAKLSIYVPELFEYILTIDRFKYMHPRFYEKGSDFDGQIDMFSAICNVKRIAQADVGGILGISEEYEYPISIGLDEIDTLKHFGLSDCRFIAVVSGAGGGPQSNKMWPAENYEILLKKLKSEHPELRIVQLGKDGTAAAPFQAVDMNLLNATSLRETMVILKYAELLISNEGGMVHLRHALHGGKSLVLFGPTDEKVFGYSENINLRGSGCKLPCEWLYDNWELKCANQEPIACMWSLTPDMVYQRIEEEVFHG